MGRGGSQGQGRDHGHGGRGRDQLAGLRRIGIDEISYKRGHKYLTVVVDHNKLQTDMPVSEIISLGDLAAKFRAFGWHVRECDGHDFAEIEASFREFAGVTDKPKILIAHTIKGKGISAMENIASWHHGVPDKALYEAAMTTFDQMQKEADNE